MRVETDNPWKLKAMQGKLDKSKKSTTESQLSAEPTKKTAGYFLL